MNTVWKVLIGLAVALPMGAYVAGSLVASGDSGPPRRDPVVIRDATPQSEGQAPVLRPREPQEPRDPADGEDGTDDGGTDDDGLDDGGDDGSDDEIEIIAPQPTRVDDDDDDEGPDDDDDSGDDDSRDGDD